MHVTVVLAVPGFVVEATFQSQDTIPSAPAVGFVLRPPAADLLPDGQVTTIAQFAPAEVWASRCATPPRGAGFGSDTNVTPSAVGGAVAPAVGTSVGSAVDVGSVGDATRAMP